MPQISIIVPVYNCETCLRRCIDSFLVQTFSDFELLLVNDGSTDSSGEICDEYLAKDSRVIVFHKDNGGVSSARNLGMDNAVGEWITFVDSDDWLDNIFLSQLYIDNINDVDLVISYAKQIDGIKEIYGRKYVTKYINSKEIKILFLENDLAWQTSPWGKLYKNNKCRDLRFIEGMHIGEDLMFLYTYLMNCNMIYILGENYYNYDIGGNNTLTKRVGKLKDELYAYNNVFKILNEFIEKYNIVEEQILNKINWIKSYYIHRVLNSLYHTSDLSASKRYTVISHLNVEIYTTFKDFSSKKELLLQFILKNKWYRLYDMLRFLVSKFR